MKRCCLRNNSKGKAVVVPIVALVLVGLATTGGIVFHLLSRSTDNEDILSSVVSVIECASENECYIDASQLNLEAESVAIGLTEGGVLECEKVEAQTASKLWHGTCSGGGNSNIVKRGKNSLGEDLVYGSVVDFQNDQICHLAPDAEGKNRVLCKPADAFPPEAEPNEKVSQHRHLDIKKDDGDPFFTMQASRFRQLNQFSCDDNGRIIDIMVVWTKQAECRWSGLRPPLCATTQTTEENMRSLISLAVEETNVAFQLSGVDAELRLVHAYRDPIYVESLIEPFDAALTDIMDPNDGILDDVHLYREKVRLDPFVQLVAHQTRMIPSQVWC